ncbi:MAG: hypothetical protein FJ100_05295 [Deltaproteobacteria bacterium]|nr:hypothetical protein [Deltaproteobacteria bacterium]
MSLAGAPTEGDDLRAMEYVAIARKGSLGSVGTTFPKSANALWPGYHLHDLPVVLVPTTVSGKPMRAYLLGYPFLPAGAVAVDGHPEAARYDPAIAELDSDEAAKIVGFDAMTVRYVRADLDLPDRFVAIAGGQAMSRLMHYEAAWDPPGACGANKYPRGVETLALWFLECAVLAEALTATESVVLEARLREIYAIRSAYGAQNDMLRRMNDHYDNAFAPVELVGLRVLRNAGRMDSAGFVAQLKSWADAPMTVPVEEFDARFVNDGTVRAVALELAYRLGWNLSPVYEKAGSAVALVPGATGGEPPPQLVTLAKARHDWAKLVQRAQSLVLPPDELPP